jgi:predicted kinase
MPDLPALVVVSGPMGSGKTTLGVLELLLTAGVTTVAEAAFQDHVWRPRLEPLRRLARIRIVHCMVAGDVAFERSLRRDIVAFASHGAPPG